MNPNLKKKKRGTDQSGHINACSVIVRCHVVWQSFALCSSSMSLRVHLYQITRPGYSVNICFTPVGCWPPVESHDRWKESVWLQHFPLWLHWQLSSENSLHSTALYVQGLQHAPEEVSCIWATRCKLQGSLLLLTIRPLRARATRPLCGARDRHTMDLIQLNRECLLHLFSFLDKDSRRSLSLTCTPLRDVFLDARLWNVLHFSSLSQLRGNNFVLGPSLRHLSICWHSSRVLQVCNIEDWLKSSFQRDICSKHDKLVSIFLARVCHMWVLVSAYAFLYYWVKAHTLQWKHFTAHHRTKMFPKMKNMKIGSGQC